MIDMHGFAKRAKVQAGYLIVGKVKELGSQKTQTRYKYREASACSAKISIFLGDTTWK